MSKKKSKEKYPIATISAIVVIVLLVVTFLCISKPLDTKSYKIESRKSEVAAYKEKNTDYIVDGWLKVQGTNIDYPVIISTDDVSINNMLDDFTWKEENPKELTKRTVIYGHNFKNISSTPLITDSTHSRFEQLISFIYYDFAKDNQFIQYTKDGVDYLFQIFSVSLIDDYDLIQSGYLDEEELKDYLKKSLDDSYFKYDIDIDENDKIITLITCTRFFGGLKSTRFKIDGKLLEKDEKAKLSKVSTKSNYQEIEEILKGGKSNEKTA